MPSDGDELDRDRVELLTKAFLVAIRENFVTGPSARDRVFEALNALAFAAATVIAGAGHRDRDGRRDARLFFDRALNENITDIARAPPADRAN